MAPAVELSLDLLRVGVWGKLLATALHQQEEAVVLRVGHLELLGTQLAHLLHGGVRSHLQCFGCATTVQLLQRHTEVVLKGGGRKDTIRYRILMRQLRGHDLSEGLSLPGSHRWMVRSAGWCAGGATGGACPWLQNLGLGLPAPP